MKFFTPELLEQYRSQDETIADRAHDIWEERTAEYDKHLASIRPQLPKGLVTLIENYSLHDADVIRIGRIENTQWKNSFGVCVEPCGIPELLILLYKTKDEPKLIRHPSSHPDPDNTVVQWMYDELEVIDAGGILFSLFRPAVFRHSILLSGNQELRIDFTDFRLLVWNSKKEAGEIRIPQKATTLR